MLQLERICSFHHMLRLYTTCARALCIQDELGVLRAPDTVRALIRPFGDSMISSDLMTAHISDLVADDVRPIADDCQLAKCIGVLSAQL